MDVFNIGSPDRMYVWMLIRMQIWSKVLPEKSTASPKVQTSTKTEIGSKLQVLLHTTCDTHDA